MKKAKASKATFILRLVAVTIGVACVAVGGYLLYHSLTERTLVPVAPSAAMKATAEKKTNTQKAAYSVPASHPRKLVIKKLNIDAIILPMGTTNGEMDAPTSAWDVGWYNQSALPGSGHGAMLIDGHVNDALNSPGVFYSLANLSQGDLIELERGDGVWFDYNVRTVQDIPLDKVDMASMLRSAETGKEGLNLITCGGWYDAAKRTYDHRVLVYATRVK
jgi:LPXTG-site transpeptidase (sortase) family protein